MRLISTFLFALVVGSTSLALAQTRPAYFDEPSQIVAVGSGAAAGPLPVVVVLAPTGGTSEAMHAYLRATIPFGRYIAILPPGAPTTADYLPAFGRFVGWMETRVLEDLERAKAAHAVDPQRIYLAGFSLGGDTSWALLARHPELFRGAVVMGSRASARPSRAALDLMRSRGCRVAFAMGSSDEAVRVAGAERTNAAMQAASVPTMLARYDGAHEAPDMATATALMRFVMTP